MFIRKINQSRNSQKSSIFMLMSLELYEVLILIYAYMLGYLASVSRDFQLGTT